MTTKKVAQYAGKCSHNWRFVSNNWEQEWYYCIKCLAEARVDAGLYGRAAEIILCKMEKEETA